MQLFVLKFIKGISSTLVLSNSSISDIFNLNLQKCAKTSFVLVVKMVGFYSTNKEQSVCPTVHQGSSEKKTCTAVSLTVKVRNIMR